MTADPRDLITVARAKASIPQITDTTYDTLLQTLVTAVSVAIEKHCRRSFYSRSLDELYAGGKQYLQLREYPVQAVGSIRYNPLRVLTVQNSSTTTNQRATVEISSLHLRLTRVASGVTTTDTSITWAGNATLTAVKNAVVALGVGWTASIPVSDYALWPSADLYIPPSAGDGLRMGALNCRGVDAGLIMHVNELSAYQLDRERGLIRPDGVYDIDWLEIPSWRVQYTAGYTTIPDDLQDASAIWVSMLWSQCFRDPGQMNQVGQGSFYQHLAAGPPAQVAARLQPYRRYTVSINQR